jgi:hypothetical protein
MRNEKAEKMRRVIVVNAKLGAVHPGQRLRSLAFLSFPPCVVLIDPLGNAA